MKYIKSCLLITMLLGVGYSQCNESNWEEYYPNMSGSHLVGADLEGVLCWGGAFFVWAALDGTIFDGANLTYAYFDENEDEYDDVSYEVGNVDGAESGDLNLDGTDNVLDVVILVDNILNP